jgi:hypothetical protein
MLRALVLRSFKRAMIGQHTPEQIESIAVPTAIAGGSDVGPLGRGVIYDLVTPAG